MKSSYLMILCLLVGLSACNGGQTSSNQDDNGWATGSAAQGEDEWPTVNADQSTDDWPTADTKQQPSSSSPSVERGNYINPDGRRVETRILPPKGFKRGKMAKSTFGSYLRNLPLKPDGAEVSMYNGEIKHNYHTYVAVIDLPIGNKDLHQCADAVMRLRAEYLWQQKRFNEIHFNFTNGFRVDYSEWMKGKRMVVQGNKTYWKAGSPRANTYQDFWNYMELIFMYAGTLSLEKELRPISLQELQIGDVFIYGGSPGHSVIVVDVAMNPQTQEKAFLLAQSYMPAQETQILENPSNPELSPWYLVSEIGEMLNTPEWTFSADDLKRF